MTPEPSPRKIIVLFQAAADAKSGSPRARILGAGEYMKEGDELTLVAYGLIARFEAKDNVPQLTDVAAGNVFEVIPGRPKVFKVPQGTSPFEFGELITGPGAAFHLDLIPLMDRYHSCDGW